LPSIEQGDVHIHPRAADLDLLAFTGDAGHPTRQVDHGDEVGGMGIHPADHEIGCTPAGRTGRRKLQ
jgi:hypothetical protein